MESGVSKGVGLVYDARMRDHEYEGDPNHPECPDRITRIWDLLVERGLAERCHRVEVWVYIGHTTPSD